MATSSTSFTHHTIAIQQVEQILLGARGRGADGPPRRRRAGLPPARLE